MAVLAASAPARAVLVDLHRVVDHQLGGIQRVDALGVAAEAHDGIAHGREIHDARHAGEVLQDDARGREGDLVRGRRGRVPLEQCLDIGARDAHAVFEAQQILQQDLERVGQPGELVLRQRRQTPDLIRAIPDLECGARPEAVGHV